MRHVCHGIRTGGERKVGTVLGVAADYIGVIRQCMDGRSKKKDGEGKKATAKRECIEHCRFLSKDVLQALRSRLRQAILQDRRPTE